MSYRSGQHGKLFIKNSNISSSGGDTAVGKVRNWSINFQQSVLDTTCLSDTDRTIMQGMRSFTGSGSLVYYSENNSNFTLLMKNMVATGGSDPFDKDFGALGTAKQPEMVRLNLQLDGSASPENMIVFAYISSFNITCSTGEVVSADFSFEGHGAPSAYNYK